MGIKRRIRRYVTRLVILGAISAGSKALKDLKRGGQKEKGILKLVRKG